MGDRRALAFAGISDAVVKQALEVEQWRKTYGEAFVSAVLQLHRETPWSLQRCFDVVLDHARRQP